MADKLLINLIEYNFTKMCQIIITNHLCLKEGKMSGKEEEMKIDLVLGRICWSCGHLEFMEDVKIKREYENYYVIPACLPMFWLKCKL